MRIYRGSCRCAEQPDPESAGVSLAEHQSPEGELNRPFGRPPSLGFNNGEKDEYVIRSIAQGTPWARTSE